MRAFTKPAGHVWRETRVQRWEARAAEAGTRRCPLATLLSNLLSCRTAARLYFLQFLNCISFKLHTVFLRDLINYPIVSLQAAFAPYRANTTFTKFRPFAGLLLWVQLIIVENILDHGGSSWSPWVSRATGAISSFQRACDEGRWGINITIIYGTRQEPQTSTQVLFPPLVLGGLCQLLSVCV